MPEKYDTWEDVSEILFDYLVEELSGEVPKNTPFAFKGENGSIHIYPDGSEYKTQIFSSAEKIYRLPDKKGGYAPEWARYEYVMADFDGRREMFKNIGAVWVAVGGSQTYSMDEMKKSNPVPVFVPRKG